MSSEPSIPCWEKPYTRGPAPSDLERAKSQTRLRFLALPALKRDFQCRCCYCTGHEFEKGGIENMVVEHFAPRCEFPQLARIYTNLYYACGGCNTRKGDRLPQGRSASESFVDPCKEAIYPEYLRFTAGGKVAIGRVPGPYLLEVFSFNSRPGIQKMLKFREFWERVGVLLQEKRFDELAHCLMEWVEFARGLRGQSDSPLE